MIVGAGASGISAAKWYQDRFGPDKKILIIDQLPDFGGHSHRNEFHVPNAANGGADVMTLRNGGTVNLDSIGTWGQDAPAGIPGSYGQHAVDFLDWAGVDYHERHAVAERRRGRHPERRSASTSGCSSRPRSSAPTT